MDSFVDQPQDQRYTIIEKISEGAFGTVFKATDNQTNELVAIKKIYLNSHNKKSKDIIEREINCVKSIKHQNVIKIYDYIMKETSASLIFELLYIDLKTYIENIMHPIPQQIRRDLLYMILRGIESVHKQRIIHRVLLLTIYKIQKNQIIFIKQLYDLKPTNIMIDYKGSVKIADFGCAVEDKTRVDGKFSIEGFSRWYKAPEILFGSRSYDFSVDIWSIGCIFAELFIATPLFKGVNDLDQISKIMSFLGSPTQDNWKTFQQLPDSSKISFKSFQGEDFDQYFCDATDEEIEILKMMISYENRTSVTQYTKIEKILEHQYFKNANNSVDLSNLKIKKRTKYIDFLGIAKKMKNNMQIQCK